MTPDCEILGGMTPDCGECGNCSVCGFRHDYINTAMCSIIFEVEEFIANESADKPAEVLENAINRSIYECIEHSEDGHPDSDRVQNLCDSLSKIEDSEFFKSDEFIESLLMTLNKTFNRLFKIFFQLKKREDGTNIVEFLSQ
jgi:hypothetical protein